MLPYSRKNKKHAFVYYSSRAGIKDVLRRRNMEKQEGYLSWSVLSLYLFISIILTFSIEVCVYNFTFWRNITNQEVSSFQINIGQGLVKDSKTARSYTAYHTENQYMDIVLRNPEKVKNICITFNSNQNQYQNFEVLVKDESSIENYYHITNSTVAAAIPQSQEINIHAAGKVYAIRLLFHEQENTKISIQKIKLNSKVPFRILPFRILILSMILLFILILRPNSFLYNLRINTSERSQQIFIGILFVFLSFIVISLTRLTGAGRDFGHTGLSDDGAFIIDPNQYNIYANSLLKGHVYLDIDVPNWLKNMINPYDSSARAYQGIQTGEQNYWDYAYFNGKYYSYFGVLPVLLAFIPYKILTGMDLRTDYAVAFLSVIVVAAIMYFVYHLIQTYTKNSSVGVYVLSIIVLFITSQIYSLSFDPRFYSLPNIVSLACTLFGLGLWIDAKKNRKKFKIKLAVGSILIGLNLVARPIFIFSAFFAFSIFWKEIMEERIFFSKKGTINTFLVIFPIVICGVLTMTYNFMRFENVFDFGVQYNLTTTNMAIRNTDFEQLFTILFLFFLQPYNIDLAFPFIHAIQAPTTYNGLFVYYPYFAGILGILPTCICIFAYGSVRHDIEELNGQYIIYLCIPFSLFIASFDGLYGAVHYRYISDFGWLIGICTVLMMAYLEKNYHHQLFAHLLIWTTILFTSIAALNLLSDGRDAYLQHTNPYIYYWVKSSLLVFS